MKLTSGCILPAWSLLWPDSGGRQTTMSERSSFYTSSCGSFHVCCCVTCLERLNCCKTQTTKWFWDLLELRQEGGGSRPLMQCCIFLRASVWSRTVRYRLVTAFCEDRLQYLQYVFVLYMVTLKTLQPGKVRALGLWTCLCKVCVTFYICVCLSDNVRPGIGFGDIVRDFLYELSVPSLWRIFIKDCNDILLFNAEGAGFFMKIWKIHTAAPWWNFSCHIPARMQIGN